MLAALALLGADVEERTGSVGALEEQGRALFAAHRCASCHTKTRTPGATGLSLPLDDLSLRYTPKLLAELLEVPPPDMPRFSLTPEERRALTAYLLRERP